MGSMAGECRWIVGRITEWALPLLGPGFGWENIG
jgi:hypothetical protein